jgi:hypothetical protein
MSIDVAAGRGWGGLFAAAETARGFVAAGRTVLISAAGPGLCAVAGFCAATGFAVDTGDGLGDEGRAGLVVDARPFEAGAFDEAARVTADARVRDPAFGGLRAATREGFFGTFFTSTSTVRVPGPV